MKNRITGSQQPAPASRSPSGPQTAAPGLGPSQELLLRMVTTLRLHDDARMRRVVQAILWKGDETAARKWVERLAPHYYRDRLVPQPFRSLDADLAGEMLLGTTSDGRPVGLTRQELVRHTAIVGQSGSGKSNLLKRMFYQARALGLHVIHFDRKGDLDHAVRDGFLSIPWRAMRDNLLRPPHPRVPLDEYRNDFVKLLVDIYQFLTRGHSVIAQGVHELLTQGGVYERWGAPGSEDLPFPTLHDLLALFRSPGFYQRCKGQGKESLFSVIDKLTGLVIELDPLVSCARGFDVARCHRERLALNVNVDGLSVDIQNLLIASTILKYAHYFKAVGPRGGLQVLILFDEGKALFGKDNERNFTIRDLVSKVRELNIGLVVADQIPSDLSQFLFSNVATLVMFRLSDGNDLLRVARSAGLSPEQTQANYTLSPGQCIVRLSRSKDVQLVTVPFTETEKYIPREEVERLIAPQLAALYQDVLPTRAEPTVQLPQKASDDAGLQLADEERRFLQCLARDFERPASHVYEELGLRKAEGWRIKERLRKRRCIVEVPTNLGQGGRRATFLVPSRAVLDHFRIPVGAGRGKALHKHYQQSFQRQAEARGYRARIEDSISGTSAAADVGLDNGTGRIGVQISITSKPSTEAAAIRTLLSQFDRVILAFVDRRTLAKTKECADRQYGDDVLRRVRFCLVNEFDRLLVREE